MTTRTLILAVPVRGMMCVMASPEKHLAALTARLQPGEEILATASGSMTEGNLARGALAVTNQRFLFAGSTLARSTESKSFPWSQVSSVEAQKSLMTAHVVVSAAGAVSRYMVKYAEGVAFAQAAQDQLARANALQTTSKASVSTSTADELMKLARLREQGILSEEEFTAAKAGLLN